MKDTPGPPRGGCLMRRLLPRLLLLFSLTACSSYEEAASAESAEHEADERPAAAMDKPAYVQLEDEASETPSPVDLSYVHLTALQYEAALLLSRAPLTEENREFMDEDTFVSEVSGLLGRGDLGTPLDAVQALETLLEGLGVHAEILSDPPGCEVLYRGVTQPEEAAGGTTTNDTVIIDARWYEFSCENQTKVRDCTRPCSVRF